VALALVLVTQQAWAGAPTDHLRGFFTTAAKILDDPATENKPEEKFRAVLGAVRGIFDFAEFARASLGPAWYTRTAAEREEFVRLFADLLQRSFVFGIVGRINLGDGVKVSYLDESIARDGATVWTTIAGKRGIDLPLTYRMIARGRGWAIRDVIIDGVSVAANYRAQFARILQGASYAELIQQIRAKASTLLDDPGVMAALAATEPLPIQQAPTVAPPAPEPPHREVAAPPAQPATGPALTSASTIPASVREPEPAQPARIALMPPSEPSPLGRVQYESSPRPSGASREQLVHEDTPPVAIPEKPAAAVDVRPASRLTVTRETNPRRAQLKVAPMAVGRSYWVQVGAFKELGGAVRLAEELKGLGLQEPARQTVILDKTSATILTRVRVGPFPERSEAMAQLRVLEARGYKPFVAADLD
jgi:phospholipid transport system substrate-binding protein